MEYVHSLPGRLRIRVSRLRGRPSDVQQIRAELLARDGIRSVTANDRLGSLLITYDSTVLSAEQVLETLHRLGLPRALPAGTHGAPPEHAVTRIAGWTVEALAEALAQKVAEFALLSVVRALI